MTRRQSNNQWRGGITVHSVPENSEWKIHWKSPRLDFFYQDEILLTDYLPKGQTINAEYYSTLLVELKSIWKEKHSGKFTKVTCLHDNAPAHRALATQMKLAYPGFHLLDHRPCSPDLSPSDYHLFPGLKNWNVAIYATNCKACV
jgi:hypothetical protein